MNINLDDIRRQQEIERVQRQEVQEEAEAIPEVEDGIAQLEDLAQEMEDRGEPDSDFEEVPQPMRVNVADIPPGVTAEEFVNQYYRTGQLLTSTDSTTVTYTNVTTGDTTYADTVVQGTGAWTEIPLPDPEPVAEEVEEVEEAEDIRVPLTPDERVIYYEEKWRNQKHLLNEKLESKISDIEIGHNDLVIELHIGFERLLHVDHTPVLPINSLAGLRRSERSKGLHFLYGLYFDKNMNYVATNNHKGVTMRKDVPRVYASQMPVCNHTVDTACRNFVVIDKRAFIESKGHVWKIKRRQASLSIVSRARKRTKHAFIQMENTLRFLRDAIERVHPVEDFDIFYTYSASVSITSRFNILLKLKDVTISNSIEMSRHIGEMMVMSKGTSIRRDDPNELRIGIDSGLSGVRMSFTPGDAMMRYQHSHLTSGMNFFGNFCTGDQSYSINSPITDLDLEHHIWRLKQFVTWESLEGGPHFKMEDIGVHGSLVRVRNNLMNRGRTVGRNYMRHVIETIKETEEGFNVFSECFTLVNKNSRLNFSVDYNRFFAKFMEIFPNDIIRDIHKLYGEQLYTYKPSDQTFHCLREEMFIIPSEVIKKARENMTDFRPVYMNGKYHRPYLTTLVAEDIREGIVFSPEPNFMKELAQLILYHLTNKLEQHGNTSENNASNGREAEAG